MNPFAQFLSDYLAVKKISQKEFCHNFDISESSFSYYINGKGLPSTKERVIQIASATNTEPSVIRSLVEQARKSGKCTRSDRSYAELFSDELKTKPYRYATIEIPRKSITIPVSFLQEHSAVLVCVDNESYILTIEKCSKTT